jgi:hypothetical protein
MLMIRYNAAHRGAVREVFPVTTARNMPVVTYAGLRWRALLEPTPEDPRDTGPQCCGLLPVLPVASGGFGGFDGAGEPQLEENLSLLEDWRAAEPAQAQQLLAHGERVHRHASEFW